MARPADPPLTDAQLDYLEAFNHHLRGEPGARALMKERLIPVLDEAGVDRSARPRSVRRGPYFPHRRFTRAA